MTGCILAFGWGKHLGAEYTALSLLTMSETVASGRFCAMLERLDPSA